MQNIKWGRVLVLLSLVGGIIALDMGIRPMVREAAASQTQIAVNRMIQRAVLEVLEEDGLRYQSFVSLQQNQSGETTALISSQAQCNVILAETIIVGLVPDAYTEVYGGTDDLVGMIQDYGALVG